jgi:hypothetical protein
VGLLDDAIREHLDLKRRRGADPAEIERAEREALGPVRRNREAAAVEESELGAGGDLDPALGSALDEPDEGTATDLVEESYGEEEPGFAEDDAYLEEESFEDEDSASGAEPLADDEDPHRTQLMRTVDTVEPEEATAEHELEPALADEEDVPRAAGRDDDDEDMLEETPEFLQDTPDHDRLWFEQRPPRDFDFDG